MIAQAEAPPPHGSLSRAPVELARTDEPLHLVLPMLLSGATPLFLGGLLGDLAYGASTEPQWSNFAAWLIAGAMVPTGFALVWSLVMLLRLRARSGAALVALLALLGAFILGFVDSLVHARDAWGIMPGAPILSALVLVLVGVALVASLASPARSEQP